MSRESVRSENQASSRGDHEKEKNSSGKEKRREDGSAPQEAASSSTDDAGILVDVLCGEEDRRKRWVWGRVKVSLLFFSSSSRKKKRVNTHARTPKQRGPGGVQLYC